MGKRWKTEYIKAGDLQSDAPIYQPFMDAWLAVTTGENTDVAYRDVCAAKVMTPALSPVQRAFVSGADYDTFNELRRSREEMMTAIPVLQRVDGSLWAYDDAGTIALYRVFAPTATVRVGIIGTDPAT